jgi:hypothetical protein
MVRRSLELRHLAIARHRAGVVEHERELELLDAPFHVGRRADVHLALAKQLGKRRRNVSARRHIEREAASLRVVQHRVDLKVGHFRAVELRVEVAGRLGGDLIGRHGGGVARQHQRGCVERCKHRGARRVGAAVVDRCADDTNDGNEREREHGSNATALIAKQT